VIDALGSLNVTGSEQAHLLELWSLDKSNRTLKPTKSEILAWARKQVISKEEAMEELLGLGYPIKYVNLYLEGVEVEQPEESVGGES
jgi:hypothetical protein